MVDRRVASKVKPFPTEIVTKQRTLEPRNHREGNWSLRGLGLVWVDVNQLPQPFYAAGPHHFVGAQVLLAVNYIYSNTGNVYLPVRLSWTRALFSLRRTYSAAENTITAVDQTESRNVMPVTPHVFGRRSPQIPRPRRCPRRR